MKPEIKARVEAHGKALLAVFPEPREQDPIKLCRALRRLEVVAHRLAERCCNGSVVGADEQWSLIASRLYGLIGGHAGISVNRDPRGCALKIDADWMREHPECKLPRDWGGYGLLAPDLT